MKYLHLIKIKNIIEEICETTSDYQSVTKRPVAASRQFAPEVIMVMFVSTLDEPRRGWDLWRFASLIPSGCRLPPIHKVRALKKRAV